ncbi:MAG: hypothetical protein ACKOTB_16575, partial [Planctomycetia bacterium]
MAARRPKTKARLKIRAGTASSAQPPRFKPAAEKPTNTAIRLARGTAKPASVPRQAPAEGPSPTPSKPAAKT